MARDEDIYQGSFDRTPVLITGGAGFIGSHLAHRLIELGASVRIIDDLSTGSVANLPGAAEFNEASILDDLTLRRVVDGCRYVFHEAAMVSVPLSVERPLKCSQINVTGTERVLEAARDTGTERFVFASSAAVYGDEPSLPSRETGQIDCRSPYAASKAAGEGFVSAFGRCYDISTVSLRYFNVFGPRQDPNSPYAAVIAAFIDALTRGERPTVFGDGRQTRDFTYIDDVVHANLLAATCDNDITGRAINIGANRRISLIDVIETMAESLDVSCEPVLEPVRAGDVRHSCADINLAGDLLGYAPRCSFSEGIARTMMASAPTDKRPNRA